MVDLGSPKLFYLFVNQRHYTNLKFIVLVYNKFQIRISWYAHINIVIKNLKKKPWRNNKKNNYIFGVYT